MAKKFQFQLEPVLRVRRIRENERMKEFGLAQNAVQQKLDEILLKRAELDQSRSDLTMLQSKNLDPAQVRLHRQYIYGIQIKLGSLQQELAKLARVAEECKSRLVGAMKDKKVMERLKEIEKEVHGKEQDLLEQKQTDEIAGRAQRQLII